MQLVHRTFMKGERHWVIGLSINPVHVGCYERGPDEPPPCYTEFEEEQFGAGKNPSWTLKEACRLYEELVRRREADRWVEDERTQGIRCFYNPDRPEMPYWTIRHAFDWGDVAEVKFGPADEISEQGHPVDRRRTQQRKFENRESLQKWYAAEVARRRSEGYVELFRDSSDYADLGNDPAILSEDVDPGKLTSDSYAEPGSPQALWMERHRRASWKPVTIEGDGPDTASKFSGLPWLEHAEDWPICPNCQAPMQLLLQLALDTLPPEIGPSLGEGLLQFFACLDRDCEDAEENFMVPYPKNQIRRLIRPTGPGRAVIPDNPAPFPPRLITGWTVQDDYPEFEEWYDLDKQEGKNPMDRQELVNHDDLSQQFPTRDGDKLGGWPCWIQNVSYPECEICGAPLRPVFQFESNENLPYAWGDNGVAHLTQCKKHKDVIGFDWACG